MNNLKAAREARAITQKQLAELSGVSLKSIQKYESGERDILKAEVGTVLKLAEVLEVTVEKLAQLKPDKERLFNMLCEALNSVLQAQAHKELYKEFKNNGELASAEMQLEMYKSRIAYAQGIRRTLICTGFKNVAMNDLNALLDKEEKEND